MHSERISCIRVFRRKSSPYLYSFQRLPFPTSRIFWLGLQFVSPAFIFSLMLISRSERCPFSSFIAESSSSSSSSLSFWMKILLSPYCHLLRRRTFWRSLPLCRQTSNVRYTPRENREFCGAYFPNSDSRLGPKSKVFKMVVLQVLAT